ncbi:large ribosomal subunit protein uL16m [Trichomonascus vanleenenianus]|uniref:mitochondrial 54S ribosomal protein uL16m MRPL16 n=1 Tax=Trichomonascus vanleenenianus TaxID=2268995 RepID=UPI003EC9F132
MLKLTTLFSSLQIGRPAVARPLFRASPLKTVFQQQTRLKHEYNPRFRRVRKDHKGRVPVRTGGSIKGSTLEFGIYGMRLKSAGVRLAAIQLKEADISIMRALRPIKGKLIRRLHTNIAVCTKGNETRMGKGKGPFDYWACRVPTGKIVFEIVGNHVHEQTAREAFRIAGDKLPGVYEFVKLGEYKPKVGFAEVEFPEKVNYVEKLKSSPTKEYINVQRSKSPAVKKYARR